MLRRFRLEEPETVADASELLTRFGENAKIYAGGTELLLAMKEGLVHYERLINIKKITPLRELKTDGGMVSIGALCTHRQLETSSELRQKLPALHNLEHHVANVRVREAGTLGGNLCFAEPHADPGTLLIALGASMVAEKTSGRREIPAEDFFIDAYETALQADELLTEIRVPDPGAHCRSAYLKFGYLERPSVGVAVAFNLNGGGVSGVKIAVGCAGPAPRRIPDAEALIEGKSKEEAERSLAEAGQVAGHAAQAISDLHGSKDYKEHIVGVLLKRAFASAAS
jgi:carbon-monoxide dehydrogenase medium subunit